MPYIYADVRAPAIAAAPAERASFEVSATASVPSALLASARTEAIAAGFAAGWAQGMNEASTAMANDVRTSAARAAALDSDRRSALAIALAALDRAAAGLEAQAVPAAADIEENLLSIATALAEALLQRELTLSGTAARDAMARVLRLAPTGERIVVQLAPVDHATLTADGALDFAGDRSIVLVADPSLSSGDAVAQCGVTQIDARLSSAMERVRAVLAS
jgi:flagellar assembly protein FliH